MKHPKIKRSWNVRVKGTGSNDGAFPKEEIYEARMLRDDNNARVLTYTDCCPTTILDTPCPEQMRHFPKYSTIQKIC